MIVVTWLVNLAAAYAAAGLVFAIAFAVHGVEVIDPVAKQSGVGFRLLIIPGSIALWPLLMKRWFRSRS
jgi:hypothetical protein